ncbi:MAG: zinc-binding dehydrogenase, partial [Actinomycetota bacterium]|nr:zinc-binding dehydrogenase [Actinomycetota bacterium]
WWTLSPPVITGWDVAGVVESAGPDAPEFKPGSGAARRGLDMGASFREDLQALADLAHAGKLTVEVAKTFPLEQTADAYRLSMEGHPRGKIIVYVS